MTPAPDPTLHHPRILCLHGGGTNARIFRAQCRGLSSHLCQYFRLVFAEAPFPSTAGPDVLPVYEAYGPFKSWLRGKHPDQPEPDPTSTWEAVDAALAQAVYDDDAKGATGPWVAVLGFSQGAKMAASVLLRAQEAPRTLRRIWSGEGDIRFRFGVVIVGRPPLMPIDERGVRDGGDEADNPGVLLCLPTVHVHGLRDGGLSSHRKLLQWCEHGSATVVEWDGGHRVPIRTRDLQLVVDAILTVAAETEVLSASE